MSLDKWLSCDMDPVHERELARVRKRKSRERQIEISEQLERLSSDLLGVPFVSGRGLKGCRLSRMLQHTIRAVKLCVVRDSPMHEAPRLYQEGLMLSTTLGVMLVKTSNMVVLQTNQALDNFWILPRKTNGGGRSGGSAAGHDHQDRHQIAGQSLWCIVDRDEYHKLEALQESILQRDSSVMGRSLDMGLLRITRSFIGGLAKVVRRRIEVLHVSEDGETFLLGVPDVKEEDKWELEVGEHDVEFLQKRFHTFKHSFWNPDSGRQDGRNQGAAAGASQAIRHGLSVFDIQAVFGAVKKYLPDLHPAIGLDNDGILRNMLFLCIPLRGSKGKSCHFSPLMNMRMGGIIYDKDSVEMGVGSRGISIPEDSVIPMWWIPGDERRSRPVVKRLEADGSTWRHEIAATSYNNFLLSTWTGQRGNVHVGSCTGYINPRHDECVSVSRVWSDNRGIERRPDIQRGPPCVVMETWEGMEEDVRDVFEQWQHFAGWPNYIDKADVLPGVWFALDGGEALWDFFSVR